jgi:hypothetical protein
MAERFSFSFVTTSAFEMLGFFSRTSSIFACAFSRAAFSWFFWASDKFKSAANRFNSVSTTSIISALMYGAPHLQDGQLGSAIKRWLVVTAPLLGPAGPGRTQDRMNGAGLELDLGSTQRRPRAGHQSG